MYIVNEHRVQILSKPPPSVREHGIVLKIQVRNNNNNNNNNNLVRFHAALLPIVPAPLFVGARTRETLKTELVPVTELRRAPQNLTHSIYHNELSINGVVSVWWEGKKLRRLQWVSNVGSLRTVASVGLFSFTSHLWCSNRSRQCSIRYSIILNVRI
jgi:hypothetical protein